MRCDCGEKIKLPILFATVSNPIQCKVCGKYTYAKAPISEALVVFLVPIFLFVSLFLIVKKEWLYLAIVVGAVFAFLVLARLLEIKAVGIRFEIKSDLDESKKSKKIAGLVWAAIFVLIMIIAYVFF